MALSGVRSSCDSVARNSSFSRLTASALARARCSLSSSSSRSRFDALPLLDLFAQRQVGLGQLAGPGPDAVLELLVRAQQRLGLALQRLALLIQLDEHRHLRLEDLRD